MDGRKAVAADEGTIVVDAATLVAAARGRWPDHLTVRHRPSDREVDVELRVARPGEPLFHVFHTDGSEMVWTDGDEAQAGEVAELVASVMDEDVRVLWVNDGGSAFIELRRAMSAQDVVDAWRCRLESW